MTRHRRGAQAPAGYDARQFPPFAVTVDPVILTMDAGRLSVLLVRRGAEPFKDQLALPGGFKRPDETLDQAAARELREETGLHPAAHLEQFKAYGDPGRDPRMNVVSVAYIAIVPAITGLEAGSDAAAAGLYPVADVLAPGTELAFDHGRIVSDALERTAVELERTALATAFVGSTFTLRELRSVYEQVWDTRIDPANFRRALTGKGALYVKPVGTSQAPGTSGGRPPGLYRATAAWNERPPLRRPRVGKRAAKG